MPTSTARPLISVVMPVRNGESWLPECMESLIRQTVRDFEVIVVDDGSTDRTIEVLNVWARQFDRFRVIQQKPVGVAVALNCGIEASSGQYIARMDADDIALPERFAKQVEFLNVRPHVGVVGSWFETFGVGRSGLVKTPIGDDAIRARLLFGSPFAHPSVMLRRSALDGVSGPYSLKRGVEDFDLWTRLSRSTKLDNIPKVLLRYRLHSMQVSQAELSHSEEGALGIRRDLLRSFGISLVGNERSLLIATSLSPRIGYEADAGAVEQLLKLIVSKVGSSGWCSRRVVLKECRDAWWRSCKNRGPGRESDRIFARSSLAGRGVLSLVRRTRLRWGIKVQSTRKQS